MLLFDLLLEDCAPTLTQFGCLAMETAISTTLVSNRLMFRT